MKPIWIRCEGSGCPPNYYQHNHHCQMCGMVVPLSRKTLGMVAEHDRKDILTMVDRGDFD